jgi:hypothetical protein
MIAYKWAIKKENKYYPLINFGINTWMKIEAKPYEINNTYIYNGEYSYLVTPSRKMYMREIDGFHFWGEINQNVLLRWNNFLIRFKQLKINSTLMCEIDDIIVKNEFMGIPRIIANKFTVLKEV